MADVQAQDIPSQDWLTAAYNEAANEDNTSFIDRLDEAQLDDLIKALSWYTGTLYADYPEDIAPSADEVFNRFGVNLTEDQAAYALSAEGGQKYADMLDQASERYEQFAAPLSSSPTGSGRTASASRSASPPGRASKRTTAQEPAARSASASPPRRGRTTAASTTKTKKARGKSPAPAVVNATKIESLESGGIKEADLWYYKDPGSTWKTDDSKTIRQNAAAQRAAVTSDLVYIKNLLTVGKTSKIPLAITKNGIIIRNLHKSALRLQAALTMYGPNVRLEVKPKDSPTVIVNPKADLEYVEQVLEQRRKIYDIYLRALRTRRPGPKREMEEFRDGNTRVLLTEEAIDWVRQEAFVVSRSEAVAYQGTSYTNLWEYIQARTGSSKEDTFAYSGLITKSNYQNLLRLVLQKVPAPKQPELTAAEKRQAAKDKKANKAKAPTVRRKAKYTWSPAMLANFVNKPASLNVVSKEDTTKVANTTGESVVTILNKRLGDDVFSTGELLSTGIMPLLISTYESGQAALAANNAFFRPYNTVTEDDNVSNKAVLDRFLSETQAIKDFYDAVSETRAVRAENERKNSKTTKKGTGRRAIPQRKVQGTPGRRARVASITAAAQEELDD